MDKEYLLKSIGLTDKEAKTYIAILELGSSTIKPISLRAGIKRTSIYNFIDHLVALGLITQAEIRGRTHYQALSPTRLIELQKERTKALESSLPEFLSVFNDQINKPKISYFEGSEQIKNIGQEVLNCHKEVCYLWPGPELTQITGGEKFWNDINDIRVNNGVYSRLIRFNGKDPLWEKSASGLEYLRETRWSPQKYEDEVDVGIGIYDSGKVGIFGSRDEAFGILIESQSYAKTMKMLFELLWDKSTPAKPGEG
jgi:HTH-type transcriptional regulator, sugar sensing transcriptional regulator